MTAIRNQESRREDENILAEIDACYQRVILAGEPAPVARPGKGRRALEHHTALLAIAQAIVDQATDGLDRSVWILNQARAVIGQTKGI